jgi:hypothetical protein
MKKTKNQSEANMLLDIHTQLIEFPQMVRKAICTECNYSLPTFYRKMRVANQKDEFDKTIPALSNAEKGMIIKVLFEKLDSLMEYFNKYRNADE